MLVRFVRHFTNAKPPQLIGRRLPGVWASDTYCKAKDGGVGSLTLTVEHLDGLSLAGYTYQWSRQTGSATPLPVGTTPTLSATAIGQYQVVLTSPQGSTCVAYTTLPSKPCRQVARRGFAHTYQCGTAPAAPLPDNGSRLSNLAPGDTIRTGDFDVVVMTVSGGSSGWTGTGYTEIPYLKNTRLAVELKGALVNDCYELVGGTIVSAYDPNWGGLTDLTGTVNLLKDAVTQLVDVYANYTGTQAERDKLSALNAQLCARINDNDKLPADQKASLLADCQAYQAASASFTACYAATQPPSVTAAPGARMAALTTTNQECTAPKDALDQLTARINGIDQSVETDKNDIQIKNRVILQKGDTLLIDDLKIVFKSPYKADYSKETGLIVSTPSSATAYGVAFEKATGRFTGFYRLDYLVSPLPTTTPCTTTSRTIGYENKPGFKACEEGFLQESIYQELYEAYPANTLSGSSLNLLTQRPQGKDPLWTGSENGYTLKLFVTDQTTTPQNRAAIAKAANKPGPTDIHLWIDYGANGQIRYEYIYGTHITAKKPASLARFFEAWLQKIRPAPSMGAENPIAQVIAGVANLVGATQIPGKYWNCDSTRYVQLPWISDASGAPAYLIAREDWAFQCGLYNGTVNVVGGLPLLFNMLIDEQQRAQLWSDLKQLKDIELSDKTVTNVFQLVYNPAQQCVTSYNRGYTVPTVFSLFVGIGELNLLGKAKSAISTLASMARKLPAVGVGIRKAAVAGTLVLSLGTSAGAFQNLPATLRAITTTVQSAVKITGRFEQLTDDVAATANGLAATGNRGVLAASELAAEGLTKTLAGSEDLILYQAADKLAIGVEIINQAQQKTFSALVFFSAVGGLVTTYVNTNPSTNNCSICTGRAMPTSLCTKLSTVRSRGGANGRAGVEKLCRSIPDNTRLEAIADRVLLFPPDNAEVSAFLGDVVDGTIPNATNNSAALSRNLNRLSVPWINAWLVCKNARPNSTLRIDTEVLTSIASFTADQSLVNQLTIGNLNRFERLLDGNEGFKGPCNTCRPASEFVCERLPMMHEYLNLLMQFTRTYANQPTNLSKFITGEATANLLSKQDGAHHQMRSMTQPGYNTGAVVGFEGKLRDELLTGGTPVCNDCSYDVKLQGGVLVDYKSYTCTTGIKESQFKQYLQCWNNGPNTPLAQQRSFQYIFNSDKLTLDQAKQKFLALFRSDPMGYYAINPAFFQAANLDWDNANKFRADIDSGSVTTNHSLFNFVDRNP